MSARQEPQLGTIAGRLKAERERLGLAQPAMAALASATRSALVKWERGDAFPNAAALAAFATAGADVLFIVTGRRETSPTTLLLAIAEHAGVETAAAIEAADRRRALLALVTGEPRE